MKNQNGDFRTKLYEINKKLHQEQRKKETDMEVEIER